jgi:hypothetical protein
MISHPYFRAYMAAIVVPSLLMLVIFTAFCIARFGYQIAFPIERVVVFPLALVPNLWGVWNILFVVLHRRRWLSLGLHGALLPVLLAPVAVMVARALNAEFPGTVPGIVALAAPVIVVLYYLFWKYFVSFFNDMLGLA